MDARAPHYLTQHMHPLLPYLQARITRRHVLLSALGSATLLALPQQARANSWQNVASVRNFVGDAPLAGDGLQITLPLVAEDGSAVPLSIKSSVDPGAPSIRRLAIFAPENPTPEIAEFEFGPDVDTLNLSTRIRLSKSQTVIAVAHTDDGSVMIAERDVRVTNSGCIAPAQADESNEMKSRVRLSKNWARETPGEVLTMITHPMTTGLTTDASGSALPQRIIKTFKATLNERPVITATYYRSLSMNPYLRFNMNPQQDGELRFEWTEDTGRVVEQRETLQLS